VEFEVFFDGDCPLCVREINMLKRKDLKNKLVFTDIVSGDFDASEIGLTQEILMARIHGRDASGQLVEGVEVFRRLYGAIGFGRLVAVSRWPGIAQFLSLGYFIFARNRLRLTGRCKNGTCASPVASGGVA
jgi:predicted DCC family thiol-disulfide oxidoreductase YuxK